MAENVKETEPKNSFQYYTQEGSELKSEMALSVSNFGEQAEPDSGKLLARASAPQNKESAARIRARLSRARDFLVVARAKAIKESGYV